MKIFTLVIFVASLVACGTSHSPSADIAAPSQASIEMTSLHRGSSQNWDHNNFVDPSWQNNLVYMFVDFHPDYLRTLALEAEAALIKARAAAQRDEAIARAIDTTVRETQMELHALRRRIAGIDQRMVVIGKQSQNVSKMIQEGVATAERIASTKALATLVGNGLPDLLSQEVEAIPSEAFSQRPTTRAKSNPLTGQLVVLENANAVESFPGGTLLSYLEFIAQRRLQATDSRSLAPLRAISAQLNTLTQGARERAESRRTEIRERTERLIAKLSETVAQLQDQRLAAEGT
jgi:hypothetical protein